MLRAAQGWREAAHCVPEKSRLMATLQLLPIGCTEGRGHTGLGSLNDLKGPVTAQIGVRTCALAWPSEALT